MQLEEYFEFLGPTEIKIKGHRIWLEHILYEHIHRAKNAEELLERFDTLTPEHIYATLLYYHRNKGAMDKYLADWLEYCRTSLEEDRKRRPEFYEKMRRLKEEQQATLAR
jgi:uncharacterized protein (DUF433 family)